MRSSAQDFLASTPSSYPREIEEMEKVGRETEG